MFPPIIMERQDRHNISQCQIFQDSMVQCRSGPWFPTGVTSKQELLILPNHLSPPAVCSEVCVARSLVFCVVVCRSLFVLSFNHCIVFPSSIHVFWLLLWYIQTFFVLFLLSIIWDEGCLLLVCCNWYNCCPHTIYTFFLYISRDARLFTCTSF